MQKELISEISSPLVSFIITTSNHQKEYLVECINSILQLSLNAKEREIILVDDGSDELVASQIKDLLDNLLYLRLPGLGSSMARNYGIYLAKGKYIQFIEGDDYLLQPTYEHCLDIVRFHNPDIVTFCFSKDDTGEPSYELPTPISGTEYLNNNTLLGSACSYIFRRAIVGACCSHQTSVLARTRNLHHNSSYGQNEYSRLRPHLIIIEWINTRLAN